MRHLEAVWRFEEEIEGELNVATSTRLSHKEFLDIKIRTKKEYKKEERSTRRRRREEDSRDHVILVLVFSFSNSY